MDAILAATYLIILTSVDGLPVSISPAHVVRLYPSSEGAKRSSNTMITSGVNCIVSLSDGKFMSVLETCDKIRKMLEESK